MNSKIIKLYDVDRAIDEYDWSPSYDEQEIQEKMYQFALDYKKYFPIDEVTSGAIVQITMTSESPKFNRKCKILVGKKMFDAEFENELIGKKKSTAYQYSHSKGFSVSYELEDIQILFVGPLTDEEAREQASIHHYPDIQTAEDFRNYLVAKAERHDIIEKSYDFLENYYAPKCNIQIDESDMDYLVEAEMKRCREIGNKMGVDFDKMKGQELRDAVGCSTIPEFKKMVYDLFLPVLKIDLVTKEFFHLDEEVTYDNRYDTFNKMVYYISDKLCGQFKEDINVH